MNMEHPYRSKLTISSSDHILGDKLTLIKEELRRKFVDRMNLLYEDLGNQCREAEQACILSAQGGLNNCLFTIRVDNLEDRKIAHEYMLRWAKKNKVKIKLHREYESTKPVDGSTELMSFNTVLRYHFIYKISWEKNVYHRFVLYAPIIAGVSAICICILIYIMKLLTAL